jgi:hypothetical protein
LGVTEDRHASLEAGTLLDLLGQRVGDTAKPRMAELVDLTGGESQGPLPGNGPLATTTIDAYRPFSWRALRLRHTSSMSYGSSGTRTSAAPPA